MSALAIVAEDQPSLRAQFAERIKAAWHKSREKIFALGNALIEAKQRLAHGEFTAMIETDLPFSPETARRFMRIAMDARLEPKRSPVNVLPGTVRALDELRQLNDEQFEDAIANGSIHERMTVEEARGLKAHYLAPAPYAIEPIKLHRPEAIKCGPPVAPQGNSATTWPEMVWMLAQRRKALGISHLAMDDKIGWTGGQTGKYELPHQDDGRIPNVHTLCEWLQALDMGVAFVPLR